ncbi:hypothetical protein M9458_021683, partial [Cirrhinus mrigala]
MIERHAERRGSGMSDVDLHGKEHQGELGEKPEFKYEKPCNDSGEKNGKRSRPTQGKGKDIQAEKGSRSLQHLPRGCTSTEKV